MQTDSRLSGDEGVRFFLKPYEPWLKDKQVTELAVNDEGRVWALRNSTWEQNPLPEASTPNLESLGTAVATYSQGVWDNRNPILSASMPDGSRIQIVQAPAVEKGRISFTMRRPSTESYSLDDFENQGMFRRTVKSENKLKPHEEDLLKLLASCDYKEFLRRAVIERLNIVCCGAT